MAVSLAAEAWEPLGEPHGPMASGLLMVDASCCSYLFLYICIYIYISYTHIYMYIYIYIYRTYIYIYDSCSMLFLYIHNICTHFHI